MSRRIRTGAAPTPVSMEMTDAKTRTRVTAFTFAEEDEKGENAPSSPLTLGGTIVSHSAAPQEGGADSYLDRLVKYIPAEIIALYLGASNVVPSVDPSYWTALWIITGLTAACTPAYMYFATAEPGKPPLWSQIVISSIAFPVWVFAIGGPFRHFRWYDSKQWVAAIVISFMTFLVGMYKPKPAAGPAMETQTQEQKSGAVNVESRQ